jgi:hypothetical protein
VSWAQFNTLRQADWLDASRAKAWRNILLVISLAGAALWIALSRGGVDLAGKALGTDFLSFYAASKLVLAGHPQAAYDVAAHRAAEISVFGRDLGYAAFFYPPLFLLICTPLAAVPYMAALAGWLAATGGAFVASLRGWLDRRLGWRTVIAFPAVLMTLGHGQNAFLSAALIGAGAMWLEARPILAGVAFGLLAFKPHLGLLLPLILIAGRRWKTFAAACATVVAFAGASLAAFGPGAWQAFLANSALARATLEQGLVEPGKMVSAFAAVRVLGGPAPLAYAVQAAVALGAAAAAVRTIRCNPRSAAEGPLIIMASLLASPFLLDYDLALLAFPLAWLAGQGLNDGFRPWEKTVLLCAYVLPVVSRMLAMQAHLPVASVTLAALFAMILRRAATDAPRPAHAGRSSGWRSFTRTNLISPRKPSATS